jgi:excinuclease ABC subunit A
MGVINKLVDKGNTILIIEHNMDVIKLAILLILVLKAKRWRTSGCQSKVPEEIIKNKKSYTAQFLKKELL